MGSAALHALALRGADVLGFDPLGPGATRGSSHGSSRIYRRFNFESLAYTALSDHALEAWHRLERASGERVLLESPILEAGGPSSSIVRASCSAALAVGQPMEVLTGAQINAAYPAFNLPEDWTAVIQESGGILLAEAAMRAFRKGVSNKIVAEVARLHPTSSGLRIVTRSGEVLAQQVIVAAGPWIVELIPSLSQVLTITRQAVGWFKPSMPEIVAYGAFPVFLIEGPESTIYGFPDFEGRGVKAAQHDHGPVTSPEVWDPCPSDKELSAVASSLDRFIPGAAGPINYRDTCLYTNTIPADLRADGGGEFIIDRLPGDPRIIVASPCSGHGAKFASAIGEILANLTLRQEAQSEPAFRLDRYSAFD